MSIGVPVKLLHEAESHIITVELKSGELYRGTLQEAEDNMNCNMTNVTMTGRDGSISTLEQVFIRGGLIRFVILPDILKNAPMFKRIDPKQGILRGKGVGIGRSTAARARRGGGPPGAGPPRGGGGGVNVRH
uniref:Small nuclear ribonucleoprotein Sm D3 n=1 Tax=Hanusia phi TaxID=3032 RepID=A0A7S0HZ17_9CRYP|mmetsp:Transcript_6667/g.15351  ORF Transcript_6667/g.15351 Transcript_6667/m.15351 type:complete len:132 (+) Transcript_6667:32-427(+)